MLDGTQRQKERCTRVDRRKRLAILLPVMATIMAAIISGGATYLSRTPEVHAASCSPMTLEVNTDRPGLDYRHPASASDASSCQAICQADAECKAYTYVPVDRPRRLLVEEGRDPTSLCSRPNFGCPSQLTRLCVVLWGQHALGCAHCGLTLFAASIARGLVPPERNQIPG
jgi:hypothetical protein